MLPKFLIATIGLVLSLCDAAYIIQTDSSKTIKDYEELYPQQFQDLRASAYANTLSEFKIGKITGFVGEFNEEFLNVLNQDSSVLSILTEGYLKLDSIQKQTFAPNHLLRLSQTTQVLTTQNVEFTYDDTAGIGVDVMIIDSGINSQHAEFTGRVKRIFDFINEPGAEDNIGHGTAIAGVVGSETYGVAKKCNLMDIKVTSRERVTKLSDVISALSLVVQQTKETQRPTLVVLAMSSPKNDLLNNVIQQVVDQGIPVITSAGNGGELACNNSPASSLAALSVGSINDASTSIAKFSNWGACVDVFSSGVEVLTTSNKDDEAVAKVSGTSISAGIVAGLAAYYMGLGKNGLETTQTIKQLVTIDNIQGLSNKPYTHNKIAYKGDFDALI